MKNKRLLLFSAVLLIMMTACGSKEESNNSSVNINSSNNDDYPATIDATLASKGEEIFKSKCTACHQLDSKAVGPALRGVIQKRSFQWLLNMITQPQEWVQKDPEASRLFDEFNKIPMAVPGGMTEDEAKAVIEYLRKESQ